MFGATGRHGASRRIGTFGLAIALWVLLAGSPARATEMPLLEVGQAPGPILRISRLILGTDHLGKVPEAQTLAVLDEAVKLGINAFDTAPIYSGDIERKLGEWMARQARPDLVVITKGGFPHDTGPGTYDSRLKGTREQIAANVLEEVGPSRARFPRPIDVYLMHRDDADFVNYRRVPRAATPAATILGALSDPALKSHYRLIGLSNWSTGRVTEALTAADRDPALLRPACHSPYFSLLEMGKVTIHSGGVQVTHEQMRDPGFQPGIRLMTYSPLAGFSIVRPGWEAARQRALEMKTGGDRYWGNTFEALFHETNAERYRRAERFTARFNRLHGTTYTLDQLLNAYVLAHPRTDFVVIGPRTVEQLRRTVASLDLAKQLTLADLDFLHGGTKAP